MTPRVLHIAYSGIGGTGEVAVELARRANRDRFEPLVCFFGAAPVFEAYRTSLDQAAICWRYVELGGEARSLWQLFRACTDFNPAVVVAHGLINALVLPLFRVMRPQVKCVAVFHGPLKQGCLPRAVRWLPGLASAHRVVAVGPHLASALHRLRVPATVIENGVDPSASQRLPRASGPAPERPDLLMVATLSPSKDHAVLLEAAALLRRRGRNFRLLLAGDGVGRSALEEQSRRLDLESTVCFVGRTDPSQTRELLDSARIFVYATHGEGCPLAILQAMAAGRPVVASRVPGVEGVIEDGCTGLLARPSDAASLAEAVFTLLDHPDFAERLGAAARAHVERHYSWSDKVARYEEVFESLLARPVDLPNPPREPRRAARPAAPPSRPDVLFVTTTGMAVEYLIRDKIEAATEAGYRVRVLCGEDDYARKLAGEGLPIDVIAMSRFLRPLQDAQTVRALVTSVRRLDPRLVHTCTPKAGLLGPPAARLCGVPVVHSVFGLLFHDRAGLWSNAAFGAAERFTAACADYLLFQSREDLARVQALGWKDAAHALYVGNGVNLERFRPAPAGIRHAARRSLGFHDNNFVVGMTARLLYSKGVGEFLEAAARLRGIPGLRFVLVGPVERDHPGAVPLEAVRAAEASGNFVYAGERRDMPAAYSAMDLFVLPSWREGIPRSLIEASAMALPVVATDIRGCREVVEPDRTGWLVPVRNAEALAARVAELAGDPVRAAALGRAGREKMLAEFDERFVHERLLRLYGQLLGRPAWKTDAAPAARASEAVYP